MKVRWIEPAIRNLVGRLEDFRRTCRVTTLARISHQVPSRGQRGAVPGGVFDPRGAEAYSTVRRARRGEKTPLGAAHRRPQPEAGEISGLTEENQSSRSPFRLLIACVISLRTKDEVTAEASRRLFAIAETAEQLAELDVERIARAIYPAGFYNTKAKQLREIGCILRDQHGGRVPADECGLLALPGVGRKTANLVLGLGFSIPAICVDTHVHRISNRLGLVRTGTPEKTEYALAEVLPQDFWIPINDLLVTFGQNRCHPTSPRCTGCELADICPRIGVTRSR